MIVSIHQPNYLPWLGYFYKILKSDVFIFLDDSQYSKNSFQNRVKIKTQSGSGWLTQPVSRPFGLATKTNEIEFSNEIWKKKHLKTLSSEYRKAKFFDEVMNEVILPVFDSNKEFSDFNIEVIVRICAYVNLNCIFKRSSELAVEGVSTSRLVNLVNKVDGTSYLSGFGGVNYQEEQDFIQSNISLQITDFEHPEYKQCWGEFIHGLSILDLLMNEGKGSKSILERVTF